MKTEHIPNGRSTPVFPRRHSRALFLTIAILIIIHPEQKLLAQGQSGQGSGELISLDFSSAPLGAPPKELRVLSGELEVVEKDGTHMLRSSSDSSFLVTVPVRIPDRFTLEFDLVPKFSGETSSTELSFEGTREPNRGDGSAQVMWTHYHAVVVGGGQDYSSRRVFSDDMREEIIGNLTQVRAEFDGDSIKLFTNGEQVLDTKEAKFVRGRVLRIELGGRDDGDNAVYLARVRMTAGGGGGTAQQQGGTGATSIEMTDPAQDTHTASSVEAQSITGITVNVDAAGVATVTWNPLTVAATYQVLRWNAGDPTCCNNMSPPGMPLQTAAWQDGVLPVAGTYAYRVIAKTAAGMIAGETQISYRGTATPPSGVVASTVPTVDVPTLATEPVTTTSSTYMTPGRLAAIAPPPGETTEDSGVITFGAPEPSSDLSVLEPTTTQSVTTVDYVPAVQTGTITPMTTTATTEPVATVDYVPAMQTGTVTPMTTTATTDPTLSASTGTSGGGGAATASGRYRVTIAGFAVSVLTKDDILNLDGMGDEVFAAAAVVNWNRQTNELENFSFVQTRDHGDIGQSGAFGDRIKAGSASMTGGLAVGNSVPGSFDPKGAISSVAP
ncbi:MAG TPA: hypothetical protein VMM36_18690, partial [Opitutaceae bacterium]|nr:hypothetical protein [Opitutaceae bacterium]